MSSHRENEIDTLEDLLRAKPVEILSSQFLLRTNRDTRLAIRVPENSAGILTLMISSRETVTRPAHYNNKCEQQYNDISFRF